MEEKIEKLDRLAREVLILSRNTLLVNLRFLDAALSQFELIPAQNATLLTDGKHVLYDPRHVLTCYKNEKEAPVRDYLHMVLHCIFRHMYMDPRLDRSYWDLACDIAVENVISELQLKAASARRENQQAKYLEEIKKEIKQPTAEKIYHYLRENAADPKKAAELRGYFYADNHEIWYMTSDEIEEEFQVSLGGGSDKGNGEGNGEGEDAEGDDGGSDKENGEGSGERKDAEGDDGDSNGSSGAKQAAFRHEMSDVWKSISQRMQTDLETFAKQQGDRAGGLTQNLQAVNREKYDYTEFLKKFAVMGEAMKINDDEFDYIFYTYGLQLYEKMPLIEPLEYKEVKRIREFVIAIDTSGSTSGELVQKFVQKTYNILKSTESFFSKINLHIIQCDAELQEDVKITNQEEFDRYLQTMEIHGLGGTDFRPVFSYVEKLRREKEFSNLKGLIYFTDGFGDFPERKPDYDTAFVYIDDDYNNPDVPSWAIKLVLQSDEI